MVIDDELDALFPVPSAAVFARPLHSPALAPPRPRCPARTPPSARRCATGCSTRRSSRRSPSCRTTLSSSPISTHPRVRRAKHFVSSHSFARHLTPRSPALLPALAGVTVFGALFFSRPISPRRFEDALAAALSRFPILAGRTRRVPNSGPPLFSTSEVFCANQGAALVVCDCSGSLSDFDAHACPEVLGRHTQRKDNHTPPGFIPRDFPATSGAIPKGGATGDVLAAFQLTRLSCGGCAVGHAISHAIVDGASVGLFLQTLADAFASAPDPSPFSSSDTADVIPSYGGSPVIPFTPLAPPPPSSTAPSSTTSASPTSSALSLSLPPSEAPIFDRAKLVAAASRPPVGKGDPEHASRRAAALLEAQPLLRCVSSAVRYKVALSRREAEMLFVSCVSAFIPPLCTFRSPTQPPISTCSRPRVSSIRPQAARGVAGGGAFGGVGGRPRRRQRHAPGHGLRVGAAARHPVPTRRRAGARCPHHPKCP